jgi:hypothetical protein
MDAVRPSRCANSQRGERHSEVSLIRQGENENTLLVCARDGDCFTVVVKKSTLEVEMIMLLENGHCFELGQNHVIVGGPNRDLFGAILRNPKTGNLPLLTPVAGEDVTLNYKIKEIR